MLLQPKGYRVFGLDLMRALAIILVVLGHCLWIFPKAQNGLVIIFQVFAFLGVEIFFVLSGFLIGNIIYNLYIEDDFNVTKVILFLKRRWFRTLPNYFLVLIINCYIAFYFSYLQEDTWRYFVFLQNFTTPMPIFFPESWSLSVEEFSYFMLPFLLIFSSYICKPNNKPRFFLWVGVFIIVFFIGTKVVYNYTTFNTNMTQWNGSLKSVVWYRLDSVFCGVLFAWIYSNWLLFWKKYKTIIFIIGLLLIGFLFVCVGYFKILIANHPFFWNVIYLPLNSIAVALLLPFLSEWKLSNAWFNKPIVFISMISYSIYLLHYSIILQLMKSIFIIDSDDTLGLTFFMTIYLLITVSLSYLLYRFFEKPIMDIRDKN